MTLVSADKATEIRMDLLDPRLTYRIQPVAPRRESPHNDFWRFAELGAATMREGGIFEQATSEWFVDELKKGTGHSRVLEHSPAHAAFLGDVYSCDPIRFDIQRGSIAYAAMDQLAFSSFVDRSVDYAEQFLCPSLMQGPYAADIADYIERNHKWRRA